jgi:hypothetical protein
MEGRALDELTIKKNRLKEQNQLVFEFLNISGEEHISILNLSELCAHFPENTPLGSECHKMLRMYTERNLKVRFNPSKLQFDRAMFAETFPKPCLAPAFEEILCK